MEPERRKKQGNSNPAEPPPDVCVYVVSNEETNPSEIQTSLVEAAQEGMTIDEASQGSYGPTEGIDVDLSSKDTATDKAFQGGRKITRVKSTPVLDENYRQLFEAMIKGDWKATERILHQDPEATTAILITTENVKFDVFSIAAVLGRDNLVEKLIKRFPGRTASAAYAAFYVAAQKGRIKKVKEILDEPGEVHQEVNVLEALLIATRSAPRQKEVIWYLAKRVTSTPHNDTVINLIKAGHLDILLHLAHGHPDLVKSVDTKNRDLLEIFVHVKSYYRSGAKLNFWEKCIYECIPCLVDTSFDDVKDTKMARAIHLFKTSLWNVATKPAPLIKRIGELKLMHKCSFELANLAFETKTREEILELTSTIVLDAASNGISEIVKLCLKHSPELMWDKKFTKELIEEVVKGRHVELFRLMNAYNTIPKLRHDIKRNRDLMEVVVEWSPGYVPTDVSGAAFLMQRELQWFKVKEDKSNPSRSLKFEETEEIRGKTYREVFIEQRKDLLKEAGQWMKDTSSSCSVVAALIFTVAFAAAFTVPGGNDSNTGIPFFLKKDSFVVFTVADALALFSSITATLMFLAILTSRYAAEDFLHSLPRKMILGLTFLFLSLVFMLVAFGSALTIVLSERWKWIYIPITLLAAFPIILFAILQLPLYVEMVESTCRPRLYHPVKIWK
ncbi:hypothetical protein BT93_C2153 [Corymbia citriodora subsp. variegata]|nr:hypothetical protein BT93_C2153 [Corymbia citriodora subsp. variegata]